MFDADEPSPIDARFTRPAPARQRRRAAEASTRRLKRSIEQACEVFGRAMRKPARDARAACAAFALTGNAALAKVRTPQSPPVTVQARPSDPLCVVRRLDRRTGAWSEVKRLNPWVKPAEGARA